MDLSKNPFLLSQTTTSTLSQVSKALKIIEEQSFGLTPEDRTQFVENLQRRISDRDTAIEENKAMTAQASEKVSGEAIRRVTRISATAVTTLDQFFPYALINDEYGRVSRTVAFNRLIDLRTGKKSALIDRRTSSANRTWGSWDGTVLVNPVNLRTRAGFEAYDVGTGKKIGEFLRNDLWVSSIAAVSDQGNWVALWSISHDPIKNVKLSVVNTRIEENIRSRSSCG